MHFLVFLLLVFSGRLVLGNVSYRKFSADWFSGREKFSGYEKHWKCFVVRGVSEGNLFWFLELRGFETVSNGFYHVPCLPVR